MEIFGWILSVIAIAGTLLTIKKDYKGFILYTISNLGWIVYGLMNEIYCQVFLFVCFFIASLYGWWDWGRTHKNLAKRT